MDCIGPQIDDVQGHTQTHPQLKKRHYWLHGPVVSITIEISKKYELLP